MVEGGKKEFSSMPDNQEAWGHVVARLMRELPDSMSVPEELVDRAKVLDNGPGDEPPTKLAGSTALYTVLVFSS